MEPISNLEIARAQIDRARAALKMPEAKRLFDTIHPAALNAHAVVQVMYAVVGAINAVECLLVREVESPQRVTTEKGVLGLSAEAEAILRGNPQPFFDKHLKPEKSTRGDEASQYEAHLDGVEAAAHKGPSTEDLRRQWARDCHGASGLASPPETMPTFEEWMQKYTAAKALHDHIKSCEVCSGPDDGCEDGKTLESECFDRLCFDPYKTEG